MDEHIQATEPDKYTIYTHNGLKMHLCDCDSDECTFFSTNITDQPSKCEVVGCNGTIIVKRNVSSPDRDYFGFMEIESCDTCTFTISSNQ